MPPAGLRILVVDDSPAAADLLSMLMRIQGHEVRTAYDGEEAVQVAEEFLPDVIVMDIGMPKMDGYEAVRRIREQPWGRSMTLIAQTGRGQEEDKRHTLECPGRSPQPGGVQ